MKLDGKRIVELLEQSGHLPELRVLKFLAQANWKAQHSATYEDLDEETNREIDALATKYHSGKWPHTVSLTFHLVVEVKHSKKPWVCLATKSAYKRHPFSVLHATNTRSYVEPERNRDDLPFFSKDCYQVDHMRAERDLVARSVIDIGTKAEEHQETSRGAKGRSTSMPIGAIRQATKAAQFFASQSQVQDNKFLDGMLYSPGIDVFHPVVVVDAPLFEVVIEDSGEVKAVERDWVPFEVSYSSPKYRKGNYGDLYYPDVVHLSYFEEYLKKVEEWRLVMATQIEKERELIGELPKRSLRKQNAK